MYQEDDEEDINWFSVITKNLTGIDFYDYKTLLISSIPMMGEVEQQILAIKESGPIVVIPRTEVALEDEEEIQDEEAINNSSQEKEETAINIIEEAKSNPPQKRKLDPKKPLILIYHTHTTESYNPDGKGQNFTTDSNLNLIRVGAEIKRNLKKSMVYQQSMIRLFMIFPNVREHILSLDQQLKNILKNTIVLKL
ncbi:stage II sporulation protein P [Caloramator sp. Dgby_cultured_2]|uniref:stage II sporulation protein P n=1 Tax=Caloramator sp. Dgby_cultured_2 TaxID=3029174 RepID=UPI00237EA9EB|nr:stage II sporulation protein P [Caloramator sp. Dgby_cultured_2]WDU84174.1 stage II sporulation protein P [Caloramator sp. Dgby_cultured_2]